MSRVSRSSRRGLGDNRCPECRMQLAVCICALLPRLPTRTRIVLLIHQAEAHKTTNTGRLALRCLPNSAFAWRGRMDGGSEVGFSFGAGAAEVSRADSAAPQATRSAPAWLTEAERPVLLFPAADALPLARFVGPELAPVTLIVPDGTWSQAARTRKRFPGLAAIPCAQLPSELVSTYRLRHDPRPGHLSTLQAIAHALGILESAAIADELLRVLQIAIERTLWTKGRLPAHLVTGGVPGNAG